MSKAKHRSYRQVLKVTTETAKLGSLSVKVTQVLWCIPAKKTTQSIHSDHIGLTTYVGSYKCNGIDARMPKKLSIIKLKDIDSNEFIKSLLNSARFGGKGYSHAALEYLGQIFKGKTLEGQVAWTSNGFGLLKCLKTNIQFHFYLCNFKNADSAYPELVKNIKIDSGDLVKFQISNDAYITRECGVINLAKVGA